MRHGRCGMTRVRRGYVPTKRTTRKVHGKDAIWVVRQEIQSGILGKIRKELEAMEGQEASKKRDDEDDPRGRRNRGRKIRSKRVDRRRRRRDGRHGRPILQTVEKFLGTRKPKRGVVS